MCDVFITHISDFRKAEELFHRHFPQTKINCKNYNKVERIAGNGWKFHIDLNWS